MGEIFLQYVSPVLSLIFGGGFFWQLFTIRSYKRKSNSDADRSEIDNLSAIIEQMKKRMDGQQQEIELLTQKYNGSFETISKLQKQILDESDRCIECKFRKFYLNHKSDE